MGLYNRIKDSLHSQFSILQIFSVLGTDASEGRKVRNLLQQFVIQGYIKRISKNMYQKKESKENN